MKTSKSSFITDRKDVYTRVTDRIVADLEQGVRPWMKPWNSAHAAGSVSRPLRHNGETYNGINVLTLWSAAADRGYSAPIWMTYKQAAELGGHVRKGEKGEPVVYANTLTRTETDAETGAEEERVIPYMKGYTVFNVAQVEGLPARYYALAEPKLDPAQRIAAAEAFFAATGADIRHGGDCAGYAIGADHIRMPPFESFRDVESYYATLAHEMTHWTRHPKRLDRDFGRMAYGDAAYAREELVAELGSAFLAADLGLALEPRDDHAAYLGFWLAILKADKRAIFSAAAHAQRAAGFLHGLQPNAGHEVA